MTPKLIPPPFLLNYPFSFASGEEQEVADGTADGAVAEQGIATEDLSGTVQVHPDDTFGELGSCWSNLINRGYKHAHCLPGETLRTGRGGEGELAKVPGQHAALHKSDDETGSGRTTGESKSAAGPKVQHGGELESVHLFGHVLLGDPPRGEWLCAGRESAPRVQESAELQCLAADPGEGRLYRLYSASTGVRFDLPAERGAQDQKQGLHGVAGPRTGHLQHVPAEQLLYGREGASSAISHGLGTETKRRPFHEVDLLLVPPGVVGPADEIHRDSHTRVRALETSGPFGDDQSGSICCA